MRAVWFIFALHHINVRAELYDTLILHADARLALANKPPGMPVAPDRSGALSLLGALEQALSKPVYAVHRLDQPVSGIALFARDRQTAGWLSAAFSERRVEKTYWALTRKEPPATEGLLTHYLSEGHNNRVLVSIAPRTGAREAQLAYRIVGRTDRYVCWEIRLLTGRKHQIRAQLAALGCPIKGDVKYGDRRANPDRSIGLHARSLHFAHPESGALQHWEAPPPPNEPLWAFFP